MPWDGNERRSGRPEQVNIDQLSRYIHELHELTMRHDEALFGKDGRGGLVRDVDRLAQVGNIAAWVLTPTCVSVVALVVNQWGRVLFGI